MLHLDNTFALSRQPVLHCSGSWRNLRSYSTSPNFFKPSTRPRRGVVSADMPLLLAVILCSPSFWVVKTSSTVFILFRTCVIHIFGCVLSLYFACCGEGVGKKNSEASHTCLHQAYHRSAIGLVEKCRFFSFLFSDFPFF